MSMLRDTAKPYSRGNVGCWADGAFGHQHVRERLWFLVNDSLVFLLAPGDSEVRTTGDELAESLRGPMPDDAWDEGLAIEWLDNFCDGVAFVFQDGDLLCIESEEIK